MKYWINHKTEGESKKVVGSFLYSEYINSKK